MERDIRRASGQWRGCYAFEGITCDGDGESKPKRTGGLKMGQTYYYYYELDDGTEIHDPSVPSTTICPYLPGQQVNLLWVPVEVLPPRERSASMSSMVNETIKTMAPGDKFLTPRAPPPIPPKRIRANTAPMSVVRRRTARSVSPRPERLQWSPRLLFGRRSPSSHSQKAERRGRWSPLSRFFGDDVSGRSPSPSRWLNEKRNISMPTARTASSYSFERPLTSRELPLRRAVSQEPSSHLPIMLPMSAEIEGGEELKEEYDEDDDDDVNFASHIQLITVSDDAAHLPTALSPPSACPLSPPGANATATPPGPASTTRPPSYSSAPPSPANTSKPLPLLPQDDTASYLPPLLSRSHFSASTVVTSPTASYFDFSDDEDDNTDTHSAEDVFVDSPLVEPVGPRGLGDVVNAAREAEKRKQDEAAKEATVALSTVASRSTFGGAEMFGDGGGGGYSLDELRKELGYLGGMIC
ncbi:hypothetical protein OIDMADRAFT_24396 [Oidiodendron maius Zn]|uniref:Uncharacterized protein n=1 Tax=Oidiodendron maius (strain Zn) TaxID=913774 RepID=A0A0C3HSR1_OIDMZ|nr:hypothetical protein OIDMADRAFT_24396 [Oidiodendron maius Zn]